LAGRHKEIVIETRGKGSSSVLRFASKLIQEN
jgi:hypothetical protein